MARWTPEHLALWRDHAQFPISDFDLRPDTPTVLTLANCALREEYRKRLASAKHSGTIVDALVFAYMHECRVLVWTSQRWLDLTPPGWWPSLQRSTIRLAYDKDIEHWDSLIAHGWTDGWTESELPDKMLRGWQDDQCWMKNCYWPRARKDVGVWNHFYTK